MSKHWTDKYLVAPATYKADDGIVLCGEAGECMLKFPESLVNLILADPDYTKGDGTGYRRLAQYGPRVMAPGAPLIVETPHKYLYTAMTIMEIYGNPQGLRWRWPYAFSYRKGAQRRLRMGIRVMYKPLLCYSMGAWINRGFVKDMYEVEPMKKTKHKWQKNLDGYLYYIERHTDPGDIVLDPYVGSGTTAFACRQLGRRFVVIDIVEKYCTAIAEELEIGAESIENEL